eukprot:m.28080 g.28080  ORF g.28080 m.28080 type:complete len:4577 (+) comp9012_c0_seq1:144-13874(+)
MPPAEDAAGVAGTSQKELCSVRDFIDYVGDVVSMLLGGSDAGLVNTLTESQDLLMRFITDAAQPLLMVHKLRDSDEVVDDDTQRFVITSEVAFVSSAYSCLVMRKRAPEEPLVAKDIGAQLITAVLPDGKPFGAMRVIVHDIVGPYFVASVAGTKSEAKDSVKPTIQAITELETHLSHMEHDTDIPLVEIVCDPRITAAVEKATAEGRAAQATDLSMATDPEFFGSLEKTAVRWIRDIQAVTNKDRDPATGSARQEISFWLNMERVLADIQDRLEKPDVQLVMDVFRLNKRTMILKRFETDTNLRQYEVAKNYNGLMRDFPITSLLAATDLEGIRDAVDEIFQHLKRVNTTKYPPEKFHGLKYAISEDMSKQMLSILNKAGLTHVSMPEFESIYRRCDEIFRAWKVHEQNAPHRTAPGASKKTNKSSTQLLLKEKLEVFRKFRDEHYELQTVISKVLKIRTSDASQQLMRDDDMDVLGEVRLAYSWIREVDILDLTDQGTTVWERAKAKYDERVIAVEEAINERLQHHLSQAKSSSEMFRIFKRFNPLFVRQRIRGAIRSYQKKLISGVKDDIRALHAKFKVQYHRTNNSSMSEVRDIPPISGQIIWMKQIEHQLDTYLQRVHDVLGEGWGQHVEGRELKESGDLFKDKLKHSDPYNTWLAEVQSKHLDLNGTIFDIELYRGEVTRLEIFVNFHERLITLSKEVRNLRGLGYSVPKMIVVRAREASRCYPMVISLKSSIKAYTRTVDKVRTQPELVPLVDRRYSSIQDMLAANIEVHWTDPLDTTSFKLAQLATDFQDTVDKLFEFNSQIEDCLEQLLTCPYNFKAFSDILATIQGIVNKMQASRLDHLQAWCTRLNELVSNKLYNRMFKALALWTRALKAAGKEKAAWDDPDDEVADEELPEIHRTRHELQIRSQVMMLSPPVERARHNLLAQLQQHLAAVIKLPQISVGDAPASSLKSATTFSHLVGRAATSGPELLEAYAAIDEEMGSITDYVSSWLQYQALWDLQIDTVFTHLQDDLLAWNQLLADIKVSRKQLDSVETSKSFASVEVDFNQVQTRVVMKYDSIHRDILGHFASKIGSSTQKFFSDLVSMREKLEAVKVSTNTTAESISNIGLVQRAKKSLESYEELFANLVSSDKLLKRQRFPFPEEWVHIEKLEGAWVAFQSILNRRHDAMSGQRDSLLTRVGNEERQIEAQIAELVADWDKNKPLGGGNPDEAINLLNIFQGRFTRLKDDYDNLLRAKEALDLDIRVDTRVESRLDELLELKSSWHELSGVVDKMNELRATEWGAVVPAKLRVTLNKLVDEMKAMPARVKSYESYEGLLEKTRSYLQVNETVSILRGDALKPRHWKLLQRALGVKWDMAVLTLGDVWDVDLIAQRDSISGVLLQAQGEKALEEFLKQIKETWQSFELEMVNYQNKTKLIKGWDDLFTAAKDHITNLMQMKLSPYYKVFEEEATVWEQRLTAIYTLFYDVWIDVQRQWVYLEGIFTGSADLKVLLPTETNKFTALSQEFVALMRKVSKNPLVLEVMNIPNVQRSLDHFKDVLDKVQKALSKYLEQERASFPRFYFVGDEDLLDIIGNGKNVERIQKHFQKMFAGITSIQLAEGNEHSTGIESKEGEVVPFETNVQIKGQKINAWLTSLEDQMKVSLASLLNRSTRKVKDLAGNFDLQEYLAWLDMFQAQLVVLSAQVSWSETAHAALESNGNLKPLSESVVTTLTALADTVLQHQPPIRRKKLEQMITELVHKRDVTRGFITDSLKSAQDFRWLQTMRFEFNSANPNVLEQLSIRMANVSLFYGFEYLGLVDKLVQTPLTDRCFLTMTQALAARQGGAPFGPAGTGKTESVKALGAQLGRFVLVFNCDETFDNHAMGRIFVGLCQVGAWGCFDEFNRLEESMLSAVSQQIESIQLALKAGAGLQGEEANRAMTVGLQGRQVRVNPDMAIFITMNPGYAGRSPLPDNLKKLFRNLAMTKPDRQLIAQVMLFSQGFRHAELLSKKVVPLFVLCAEQLSDQSHYDFGLRSLKSVLVSAGNIKRDRLAAARKAMIDAGQEVDEEAVAASINEQEVVIQSVTQTMIPKLVAQDIPLLNSLLADVFPGITPPQIPLEELTAEILKLCKEQHVIPGDMWMNKVLQLYQVTTLNHGLMLVGPSGAGKSTAWKILLEALRRLEKKDADSYVIDPKAISKDELYGFLDPTTREWTDGLFTSIIRKVIDNVRGERNKRQWVIFDGDVDPEWVENLNSVLDDNKLLTLPNGERLNLPPNIRVIFEVQDLKHATLATVSRCGMVWFSQEVLGLDMYYQRYLLQLRNEPVDEDATQSDADVKAALTLQQQVADVLEPHLQAEGTVTRALKYAADLFHVMTYTETRCLNALFSMLNQIARSVIEYNTSHPDFPLQAEQINNYATKRFVYSLMWCLVGDSRGSVREDLSSFISDTVSVELPPGVIIDFEVTLPDATWQPWSQKVPRIEIEGDKVAGTDVVVPTLDTVRHEDLLYTWLSEHLPIVLCGPPGSGKTMTLFSALRALPHFEVAGLNFSSTTTPDLILKTFDQYCEYRSTPNGLVLAPAQLNKWLVVFMDECNLPAADKYATVKVATFVRQMIEQGGFWRTEDLKWVKLERIQFVGACNPPTDPGRVPLAQRLLRHMPVVYVDYPGAESLKQIYGTFNRAVLRTHPTLERYGDTLTNAMVDFYMQSQTRFTADMQPHYIYSPREMTRWVKGVAEAITPLAKSGTPLEIEGLVRVWAHEALRLFQDRLVHDEERQWTDEKVDEVARTHFPGIDYQVAVGRPILFSDWLSPSKEYGPVELEALREFMSQKLVSFTQEQVDLKLVLFDEVLDHALRIDRVFRQNQGHMLLIGVSGCGRTTLARFVAWMNDLTVVQIKSHSLYTADDFDTDLRELLKRSGVDGEKIVFILDEGNIMDTAFLERMNTLLANGEVPGLFEGDEYSALMTKCKEAAKRHNLHLDDNDELYKWFSRNVMDNLHIVFTMCPSEGGMQDRATTSPALFNRCVLDWFGDWPTSALFRVASEFTSDVDFTNEAYEPPMDFPVATPALEEATPDYKQAVCNAAVFVHASAKKAVRRMIKREGRSTAITPRHFLEFINQFSGLYLAKKKELEEQREHLLSGVVKIDETRQTVEDMQGTLAEKKQQLEAKSAAAKEKLELMLGQKQAANDKRSESLKIDEELKVKQAEASERKASVEDELAAVAPAVEEAKMAVQGISQRDLNEIKSLAKPPKAVQVALEGALTLMGKNTTDWRAVRTVIAQTGFTSEVLNFDSNSITRKAMAKMEKNYIGNELFTFEKANRASKAAGPLVKWAVAQIAYANQLLKVEPLNQELSALEASAEEMRQEQAALQVLVAELEATIQQYEAEYAVLISEQEAIKNDLTSVSEKVARSEQLLDNLASEKERWSHGAEDFAEQTATIIGDCFLASAFLGYGGYFDQSYRARLFTEWTQQLSQSRVVYKPGVEDSMPEYLSSPDDRMRWKTNALPEDELCMQNAIMLKRTIRTPLVIDPSGQAATFIMNEYNKDNKMVVSSFLNPQQLRKDLESALRFGTKLFLNDADADNFDAILNPVLNNEVQSKGGRIVVNIAGKDIDLSPSFSMMMITRNPAATFPIDLCSRVTLINFTVTRSSLQTQCLNQALRSERPDVDEKRSDLLKMQGEFRLTLLKLEHQLLDALNTAEGSILENDKVISQLETLKVQATEVQQKVNETDTIMATVEETSQQYAALALRCSSIYFTLDQLASVHFLYRYSLHFFLDIFMVALQKNPLLDGVDDYDKRLSIINDSIFAYVYQRVAPGMMHEHRLPLALTFAKFRVAGTDDAFPQAELSLFMSGGGLLLGESDLVSLTPTYMSVEQADRLHVLCDKLSVFKSLVKQIKSNKQAFRDWLALPTPEAAIPDFISALTPEKSPSTPVRMLREVLLLQAARPDRVLSHVYTLIGTVLGESFLGSSSDDLASAVPTIRANTPILLCGVKGFDTSVKVDDCALALGKKVSSIAVGSGEAKQEAMLALGSAATSGRWLMLKNVHLAPDLLVQVENKLAQLTPHPEFQLFLTSEINPKLPVNLIRAARVFLYEAPAGIKESIKRTLTEFPDKMEAAPQQRSRVYLLLAWLHAVVQERLRYAPLGWSKKYEFGEADLRTAGDTIEAWITDAAAGRDSIDATELPWDAMKTLLSKSVYGGRIDNDIDQRLLEAFVGNFFTPKSFLSKFAFVEADASTSTPCIKPPSGTSKAEVLSWADSLPAVQLPTWLGLPANAERVLLASRATLLATNTMHLQTTEDDGGEDEDDTSADGSSATPAWMRQLLQTANEWLGLLPTNLGSLERTAEAIKDPLFRFFDREAGIGKKLLESVRKDLGNVIKCCEGELKQTNFLRDLMKVLLQGGVPKAWLRYKVPDGLNVAQWIVDFSLRIKQLNDVVTHISSSKPIPDINVWLGGLFVPEAFITATRQSVAQRNEWPLEALVLELNVRSSLSDIPADMSNSFRVTNVRIEGATCKQHSFSLVDDANTMHPLSILKWTFNESGASKFSKVVNVPLYLNAARSNIICTIDFEPQGATPSEFYRRGVAMVCSTLSGVMA